MSNSRQSSIEIKTNRRRNCGTEQLNRIEMKKVIKFLLLVAVVAMTSSLFAQTNTMLDVVYCKNGSVIKGVIIEQIPNQSIKIQTSDGNIFVYSMEDVQKITKEQADVLLKVL